MIYYVEMYAASPYLHGWWVHEVERQKVVDPHCLERKHSGGKVGPLNLRHSRRQHLIPVSPLCVQSVAFPGASTTSPTCPLLSLSLRG